MEIIKNQNGETRHQEMLRLIQEGTMKTIKEWAEYFQISEPNVHNLKTALLRKNGIYLGVEAQTKYVTIVDKVPKKKQKQAKVNIQVWDQETMADSTQILGKRLEALRRVLMLRSTESPKFLGDAIALVDTLIIDLLSV